MPTIPHEEEIVQLIMKKGLPATVNLFLDKYFADHEGELPAAGLYDRIMEAVERPLIQSTLKLVENNQKKAAQVLGINRNTLRKKITDLGVSLDL